MCSWQMHWKVVIINVKIIGWLTINTFMHERILMRALTYTHWRMYARTHTHARTCTLHVGLHIHETANAYAHTYMHARASCMYIAHETANTHACKDTHALTHLYTMIENIFCHTNKSIIYDISSSFLGRGGGRDVKWFNWLIGMFKTTHDVFAGEEDGGVVGWGECFNSCIGQLIVGFKLITR